MNVQTGTTLRTSCRFRRHAQTSCLPTAALSFAASCNAQLRNHSVHVLLVVARFSPFSLQKTWGLEWGFVFVVDTRYSPLSFKTLELCTTLLKDPLESWLRGGRVNQRPIGIFVFLVMGYQGTSTIRQKCRILGGGASFLTCKLLHFGFCNLCCFCLFGLFFFFFFSSSSSSGRTDFEQQHCFAFGQTQSLHCVRCGKAFLVTWVTTSPPRTRAVCPGTRLICSRSTGKDQSLRLPVRRCLGQA